MKKIIFFSLILTIFILNLVSVARAQVTYPINITVYWTPNSTSDNVTSYTFGHNGVTSVVDPSSCSATECTKVISVTSSITQLVSVIAVNMFGSSIPSTLQFTAVAPGRSGNIKVRVGP